MILMISGNLKYPMTQYLKKKYSQDTIIVIFEVHQRKNQDDSLEDLKFAELESHDLG